MTEGRGGRRSQREGLVRCSRGSRVSKQLVARLRMANTEMQRTKAMVSSLGRAQTYILTNMELRKQPNPQPPTPATPPRETLRPRIKLKERKMLLAVASNTQALASTTELLPGKRVLQTTMTTSITNSMLSRTTMPMKIITHSITSSSSNSMGLSRLLRSRLRRRSNLSSKRPQP